MNVTFIIDGFNLYHSVRDVGNETKINVKWLDVRSLCESYLSNISKDARLRSIYYFSAYAFHTSSQTVSRHKNFVRALANSDITIVLNRFKETRKRCQTCHHINRFHEEKRTDVAIGVKILELCFTNEADTIVLVSGDTDMIPAIQTARDHFPEKEFITLFPYGRTNRELSQVSDRTFKISKKKYQDHQFSNVIILNDGDTISRPQEWCN